MTFGRDSLVEKLKGFCSCDSLIQIEIPARVKKIEGFCRCKSLVRIIFAPDIVPSELSGFDQWESLGEVDFPSSLRIAHGFGRCDKLHRVTFPVDGSLIYLAGFDYCSSLSQINIPKSFVTILGLVVSGVRLMTLPRDTKIAKIAKIDCSFKTKDSVSHKRQIAYTQMFVDYMECDLVVRRRWLHLVLQ